MFLHKPIFLAVLQGRKTCGSGCSKWIQWHRPGLRADSAPGDFGGKNMDRMQKCSGIQHFTRLAQSEAASLPERHTACMAQLSTVCCDCDSWINLDQSSLQVGIWFFSAGRILWPPR